MGEATSRTVGYLFVALIVFLILRGTGGVYLSLLGA
jgi:hypothetical protein